MFFVKVEELMTRHVVSVVPEESAALAARLLSRHGLGALPVCDYEGRLQGIVTDRDIITRCVAAGRDAQQVSVGEIMTPQVETVAPQEDVHAAVARMAKCQIRRVPVTEQGRVVGMVSLGDVAARQRFEMEVAEALGEISANVVKGQKRKKQP